MRLTIYCGLWIKLSRKLRHPPELSPPIHSPNMQHIIYQIFFDTYYISRIFFTHITYQIFFVYTYHISNICWHILYIEYFFTHIIYRIFVDTYYISNIFWHIYYILHIIYRNVVAFVVLPCQALTHHRPAHSSVWQSPRLSGEMLHISNWSKLAAKSLWNVSYWICQVNFSTIKYNP